MERRGRVSRIVKSHPIQVQQGNKLHGDICVQQACMAHSLPPHRLCVAGRLGSSYCTREVLCACVVPSWLPASSQSVVTHTQASIMRCVVWGAEQKDEPWIGRTWTWRMNMNPRLKSIVRWFTAREKQYFMASKFKWAGLASCAFLLSMPLPCHPVSSKFQRWAGVAPMQNHPYHHNTSEDDDDC